MTGLGLQSETLPVLRPDIEFHLGPDSEDGSPTYVIHDPLRGTFEQATWVQAEILRRLRVPMTVNGLLEQLAARTTIKVCAEDVTRLCADASTKGLTMDSRLCDQTEWEAQQESTKARGLPTLFRKLVFMRIPLIRPDAFLARTVDGVSALVSPPALVLYASLSLIGVILVAQQFDAYLSTFPYFFNAPGVVAFTLVLVVVKTIHEFSHAYVAKALGNRVSTMGVALIFLFPMAYADVTDSWRMRSRRKRLLISLAGVTAEMVIAGLALFVWAISPPGLAKSICFVVSSVTLLSTLLVNLNPVMRFDGYYVLSDLLGIDNLQSRAFAVTRWVLRRHILGMKVAAPEVSLSSRRLGILVAYALSAWTYRLFLYAGIALMVYLRLTKVIGGALFFVTIYTFVGRPVVSEIISIFKMRRLLSWKPRTIAVVMVCGFVLLWAALPLPRRQALPATSTARHSQVIYAPGNGVIRELDVGLNSRVRKGQTLFVVESKELESQAELARLEVQRIGIELAVIKGDEEKRPLLPQKTKERTRAAAKLDSILTALKRNRLVAKIDGVVVEWDESVREGTPIGSQNVLGRIVDLSAPQVLCYISHDLVTNVAVGDRVYFCSDARPGRLEAVVTFINPVRTVILEHPGLSSLAGGDIAVTQGASGRLEVVDSYYEVEVALDRSDPNLRLGQTGTVWMRTAPRSRVADLVRYIYRILIRESSF